MSKHKLTCHCGAVEISLELPNGLGPARRCNCSICGRRGAIVASVFLADLKVLKGNHMLSLYTFNTHTAKHYFCKKCGVYTHHKRRSVPIEYSFNLACVEGVKIEDFAHVGFSDGRDNHSSES